MSVNPDKKSLFTENEVKYLSNYSWGRDAVQANAEKYGDGKPAEAPKAEKPTETPKELHIVNPDTKEKVSLKHETFEKVKAMPLDEVKEALVTANLSTDGTEGEVRARLAIHLESK